METGSSTTSDTAGLRPGWLPVNLSEHDRERSQYVTDLMHGFTDSRQYLHDGNTQSCTIVYRGSLTVPRIHFQLQLAELKDKILAMAALAQQAVESSVDAYLQRDAGLCQYVRENETAINTAQRALDEMAYELLAKEQPMAIDLRFILAVIKINGDLERIGDQSMSIAVRTRDVLDFPEVSLPVDLEAMGEYASRMIRTALQALLEGDAQVADSVRLMDDEIDRMNHRAQADLLERIQRTPGDTPQALNALLIARNLERIADHATNIATDVIFWIRGADVRHTLSLASD
jgi:phosphate transport system protein